MTLSISSTRRSTGAVRIAGTTEELWAYEHLGGSRYRLFCMIESHYKTCRVRTFATYNRAWVAALAANASGHTAALFVEAGRSEDRPPHPVTSLEVRLDPTRTVPTIYWGAVPIPRVTDSKRMKRLLYEGSL